MSKKYQYLAKKRKCSRYFEAQTACTRGNPNNATTCKTCLKFTGRTRAMQQQYDKNNKKE